MVVIALTDVESVALWAGLIVGIASVVLAVVAIYFSIEVDRRSTATSTSTIQSLERIESVVAGQSRDTRDLIKVGWERMLPVAGQASPSSRENVEEVRELAAGIADEIRVGLGLHDDASSDATEEALPIDDIVRRLRATVESQLNAARRSRPGDEVQFWLEQLDDMSEASQAVARVLADGGHVTATQLRQLEAEPLVAEALDELRADGVLVPLRGYNKDRKRTLVYWYPPGEARAIRAALLMLPDLPEDVIAAVVDALEAVGYPDLP